MKIRKVSLLVVLLSSAAMCLAAQEAERGKPIIVLFGDYTAGLGRNSDVSGFNLTRSRFGYEYQATPSLKATVALDVNAFEDDTRTVNFHYAMVEWSYRKLAVSGGLIYLSQFEVQEAFWGRRYIDKSHQDLYGFGYDSDLGVKAKYVFAEWLSADFAITNGEGTLNLNNNNTYKYGLGITLQPAKGFTVRAYGDLYGNSADLYPEPVLGEMVSYTNQSTVALFAGYSHRRFSLGVEYNRQMNRSFIRGCDYTGLSVYAGAPVNDKLGLYGKYDYVETETPDRVTYDWESVVNKHALVVGFEYKAMARLLISPNYRYMESLAGDGFHAVSVNVGFSL